MQGVYTEALSVDTLGMKRTAEAIAAGEWTAAAME